MFAVATSCDNGAGSVPRVAWALFFTVVSLFVLVACAETSTGPTTEVAASEQPKSSASIASDCPTTQFLTFQPHWDCVETVRLRGATPFLQNAIIGPVDAWHTAIQAAGYGAVPHFTTTTDPNLASATVSGVSGGTEFCGAWSTFTNVLSVMNESNQNCANSANRGSISALLLHELAHVWGWAGGSNLGHNGAVAGVSDHCALALPPVGLNVDICAHNVEGGLAAYGHRSFPSEDFWYTPFVTGHDGPYSYSPITLQEGEADTLQLGSFYKERGGLVSGAWSVISSNPAVATATSSGIITAVDSGTATITVKPSAIAGHFRTSQFMKSSRTVQVTVTPEPPAALVVQNITINTSLPITTVDDYQWTAVLGSGNPAGITFRWVFEFSGDTPPDSVFIPSRQEGDTDSPWIEPYGGHSVYVGAGQSLWQTAHYGSYNIRVKVWPIRDGAAGMPAVRDFPVCTEGGGGGDFLRAGQEKESPPGTDAVEGCP